MFRKLLEMDPTYGCVLWKTPAERAEKIARTVADFESDEDIRRRLKAGETVLLHDLDSANAWTRALISAEAIAWHDVNAAGENAGAAYANPFSHEDLARIYEASYAQRIYERSVEVQINVLRGDLRTRHELRADSCNDAATGDEPEGPRP